MTTRYVSIRTASYEILDGLSEFVIREAIKSGELPVIRLGKVPEKDAVDHRSIRIDVDDLIAWAQSKGSAA